MESGLISALQAPERYPHPVSNIRLIETHISWVLLTGDYVYKIKKPLELGFLDFRELSARKHYCEEELRLNRRLAEPVYEAVVPISGSPQAPAVNGNGTPIEYAVRMRQFDPEQTLDQLSERGELTAEHLDELAERVAGFHESIPSLAPDSPMGQPDVLKEAMEANFTTALDRLDDPSDRKQAQALLEWTRDTFEQQRERIQQRLANGRVRECHGDLHLGNIALFEGRITVFDCIEFNPEFRWIDTANDLAFLLMDLESRGHPAWSTRVLNQYLEHSGDFDALALLRLFSAYRAMVRAKIALLSPADTHEDWLNNLQRYRRYAQLAEHYSLIPQPWLAATTGYSASGKSLFSAALAEQFNMIRLRSDVERKRLYGLGPKDASDSAQDAGIYTPQASEKTYKRLESLAYQILSAGYPVIVDAAALRQHERDGLAEVAESLATPFVLLACEAPESVLRERIRERAERKGEVSEADEAVLEHQLSTAEPIGDSERSHTIHIHTDRPGAMDALLQTLPPVPYRQ
ncbi:AAA family ATPase [Halomonadaceae bacterium KBTZ08]